MTGADILGGHHLAADHRVLVRLHDLTGDALADDLLRSLVHQRIGYADDLEVRLHHHIVLVCEGVADADGGLVAGDVQLHHFVLAQTDAAALQQGGQALGLGGEGAGVLAVGDGDGAPRLEQQLHGLVAHAAAQQQIVIGALRAAVVQHMGTVAVHHDADGIHGADRLCGGCHGKDHGGGRDHGDDAERYMVTHNVAQLLQLRGM